MSEPFFTVEVPWPGGASVNELYRPFNPAADALYRRYGKRMKGRPDARISIDYHTLLELRSRLRFALSLPGKNFKKGVTMMARVEYRRQVGPNPVEGEVVMLYEFWVPDKRKRDLTNLPKAIEDAIVDAGVLLDDRQVVDARQVRRGFVKGGHVRVHVWHAPALPFLPGEFEMGVGSETPR